MDERLLIKEKTQVSPAAWGNAFIGELFFADPQTRAERSFEAGQLKPRNPEKNDYGDIVPHDPEQIAREQLLNSVSFSIAVFEGSTDHTAHIRLSFFVPLKDGNEVSGSHIIRDVPRTELIDSAIGVESNIERNQLEQFGISITACRFDIEDEVSEWRFYVTRKDNGERLIVTFAENDHWQKSHAHKSFVEEYTVLEGTLVLVTEDKIQPHLVHVKSLSTFGQDAYFQYSFTYNLETGDVTNCVAWKILDKQESPVLTTETDANHNVFLFEGTVIGTTTTQTRELSPGEEDRTEEEGFDGSSGFDGRLNQRKGSQSVEAAILEEIRIALSDANY